MKCRTILAVTVGLALVMAFAGGAYAAAGALEDLAKFKDYKAARQSSFDPSGGNADGRQDWPIEPGETRPMATIEGAGAITHIWVTIATEDKEHLRNLVLRMYWGGEESPSVETPIGDFFGLGYAKYYQYCSMPIQIGTMNGLNCFWRMPFSKGAKVTITNDGPVACGAFYYYVDYQLVDKAPEDEGRFHAQYRQEYPCTPNQNYLFMEATGKGHYVGVNLSIHNRADGWWGEGDDMIYIDGEEKPTFNGTGSEDYFSGAWCYGPAFSNPYFGCPLRGEHKANEFWNVYRYHIENPIPFGKSIKATIEHGHANDRNDDFSSVAYWYQSEPHVAFPALPAAADRLPKVAISTHYTEPGAIEVEAIASQLAGGKVSVQEMGSYADKWSDGSQLWMHDASPAKYTIAIPAPGSEAGDYKMKLWYTAAPDYGICTFVINGKEVASWDGYNKDGVVRRMVEFPVSFLSGDNAVEISVKDKNASSKGYYAGIDCVVLDK